MRPKSALKSKSRQRVRVIRPLTTEDTQGAPFVAVVDASKLSGISEILLRRHCQLTRFGNADFVRVAQVNHIVEHGTAMPAHHQA